MFRQVRTKQPLIPRMRRLRCNRLSQESRDSVEHEVLQQRNRKENIMSNSNSSNRATVPQAREALNRFKMEVANEIGVPLKEGYNGDLTSAQNGSVGGEMVRQMIRRQEEAMSNGSK